VATNEPKQGHIVLAITGASGAIYAVRLLQKLLAAGRHVHLIVSDNARRTLADELGIEQIGPESLAPEAADRMHLYDFHDVGSRLASGSFLTDGMVICPCSANTLGAVAAGLGDNGITRAAAVHLKERRPLLLVYREMPVSRIDLENMLKVDAAGAVVFPACPGFYLKPRSVEDLVDFVVAKILDQLGIEHDWLERWRPMQ